MNGRCLWMNDSKSQCTAQSQCSLIGNQDCSFSFFGGDTLDAMPGTPPSDECRKGLVRSLAGVFKNSERAVDESVCQLGECLDRAGLQRDEPFQVG